MLESDALHLFGNIGKPHFVNDSPPPPLPKHTPYPALFMSMETCPRRAPLVGDCQSHARPFINELQKLQPLTVAFKYANFSTLRGFNWDQGSFILCFSHLVTNEGHRHDLSSMSNFLLSAFSFLLRSLCHKPHMRPLTRVITSLGSDSGQTPLCACSNLCIVLSLCSILQPVTDNNENRSWELSARGEVLGRSSFPIGDI